MKIALICFIVIALFAIIYIAKQQKQMSISEQTNVSKEIVDSDDLDNWDDASLFVEVATWALERHDKLGIDELNEVERTVASLYLLDAEVNNGGFGQWLYSTPGDLISVTIVSLETMGADNMAQLVSPILDKLGTEMIYNEETRVEHLDSIPESVHEVYEQKIYSFSELEEEFLYQVYQYVRKNWRYVRKPDALD